MGRLQILPDSNLAKYETLLTLGSDLYLVAAVNI